jgi:hypothetical protein
VVALAELLVTECATIERVVLDNNPMFGTLGSKHAPGTADKFASAAGTADFFSGVQQSGLTALSICACGMGPAACSTLAACMPASLSELAVAHNPIGKPSSPAALRPGVEQAVVLVGAEVLAALRGRFGKVLGDPDEDEEVKLRWLVRTIHMHSHLRILVFFRFALAATRRILAQRVHTSQQVRWGPSCPAGRSFMKITATSRSSLARQYGPRCFG